MAELVLQPTETAQWHALVNEAQAAAAHQLDESLESYLVFLLMRFTRRPDMFAQIMAKEYLNCQADGSEQRSEKLRDIGDHCLLFSGLFPHQAERRLVNIGYFVDLGRTAYHEIAHRSSHSASMLFAHLAEDFVLLMDILHAIRTLQHEQDPHLGKLQAFELWQETGSQFAFDSLNTQGNALPIILSADKNARH